MSLSTELPADLTKAEASEHIDGLRAAAGQEEGSGGEGHTGDEDSQETRRGGRGPA